MLIVGTKRGTTVEIQPGEQRTFRFRLFPARRLLIMSKLARSASGANHDHGDRGYSPTPDNHPRKTAHINRAVGSARYRLSVNAPSP